MSASRSQIHGRHFDYLPQQSNIPELQHCKLLLLPQHVRGLLYDFLDAGEYGRQETKIKKNPIINKNKHTPPPLLYVKLWHFLHLREKFMMSIKYTSLFK
jgi:hypothetical protein